MNDKPSPADVACQRLGKLLDELAKQGVTQNQVAERAGIPATYLSDVKRGQRPLGELFARRIGEEFAVDYRWLLGQTGTMDSLARSDENAVQETTALWLPVFPHPVQGPPRELAEWDGSCVEVCGAAAARVRTAYHPYALRFGKNDHQGRLRRNDLLLISQQESSKAEIHVIRVRGKLFLARRERDAWTRLAEGKRLSLDAAVVGHCVGILWGPLVDAMSGE
jgi:transcriptional regulator with XRE-family HTH domain